MTDSIFVGNIPTSITDQELFDLFSPMGQVVSAKVAIGINGKNNAGYGYVRMNDDKEMQNAILKLNNIVLKGNSIKVIRAHPIDQDNNYLSRLSRRNRFRRRGVRNNGKK